MARTTKSDVFFPELLADAISAGLAGMTVMAGTGAAIIDNSLIGGADKVGEKVKVPYFDSLGEADEITTDGDALTPVALASSAEEATVRHFGKAVELTRFARGGAADPYAKAAALIVDTVRRAADKILIDAAKDSTDMSSMTLDNSGGGGHSLTLDDIIDGQMKFGDEQDRIAAIVVHSAKLKDLLKLKDSTGRPILIADPNTGVRRLAALGFPVYVTDRLAPVSSVYTSLILKTGSLALWLDGTPSIDTQKDVLRDSTIQATHVYGCVHRYKKFNGLTKPGVVILKNN